MHNYKDFSKENKKYYENMLRVIGSLSRLFSESAIPYLDSRIAENLYCKSFNAENKSRDDSSIDAIYNKTGIGIKTFAGNSAQKIAEFNKDILQFSHLPVLEKTKKIAGLRNKRIDFTKNVYGINDLQYHCIRREKGKMILCESPMDLIDIERLKIQKDDGKSIKFTDGKNNYNFNISKSVLLKQFRKENLVGEINIKVIGNPFEIIEKSIIGKEDKAKGVDKKYPFVILPLYSIDNNKRVVQKRSGLNQWNAGGRKRDIDEVYIQIPSWIHKKFAGFFPKRKTKFCLRLPNGNVLSAKICQDNNKALMSDPNKALGKWILRDLLHIKKGKLITYKSLQEIGIDSVIIRRLGNLEYSIDFKEEGEFDKFKEEYGE